MLVWGIQDCGIVLCTVIRKTPAELVAEMRYIEITVRHVLRLRYRLAMALSRMEMDFAIRLVERSSEPFLLYPPAEKT